MLPNFLHSKRTKPSRIGKILWFFQLIKGKINSYLKLPLSAYRQFCTLLFDCSKCNDKKEVVLKFSGVVFALSYSGFLLQKHTKPRAILTFYSPLFWVSCLDFYFPLSTWFPNTLFLYLTLLGFCIILLTEKESWNFMRFIFCLLV